MFGIVGTYTLQDTQKLVGTHTQEVRIDLFVVWFNTCHIKTSKSITYSHEYCCKELHVTCSRVPKFPLIKNSVNNLKICWRANSLRDLKSWKRPLRYLIHNRYLCELSQKLFKSFKIMITTSITRSFQISMLWQSGWQI